MAESLTSVTTAVLNYLGDSTNTIWSNAEVQRYIKEGYDDLLSKTLCLWTYGYLNDVAATATYSLPAALIKLERVTWDYRKLPPSTFEELSRRDPNFLTVSQGPPQTYSNDLDGLLTLRKYPIPGVTAVADQDLTNTRIEYYKRGTALVASSQEAFDIPDYYVKFIRFFALFRALERNGTGQDLKLSTHFKARYDDGVARMLRRKLLTQRSRRRVLQGESPTGISHPRYPWAYGPVVGWPRE